LSTEFPIRELTVPFEHAGQRVDLVLAQLLAEYSRARIQSWIRAGKVQVDGRAPRARDKVYGGERIIVEVDFPADTTVAPEALALDVVHQDRGVFVIHKPAGLVVHPGAGNSSGTMQNALLALDPALARVPRAGIVHRLDKDTSGLLLVARTPEVHKALVESLAARAIEREYLTLCHGVMTGGGTVEARMGRHRSMRTKMAVRPDGRDAVTHYRLEQRYRAHTLARVQLETGRTHQIRVHLAHIGYPIVGDPAYGGRKRVPAGAGPLLLAALAAFRRQALHATRLAFAHPLTDKPLEFSRPVPEDFAQLLAVLAADSSEALK